MVTYKTIKTNTGDMAIETQEISSNYVLESIEQEKDVLHNKQLFRLIFKEVDSGATVDKEKKRVHKRNSNYAVFSTEQELMRKLMEANLFHKCHGVNYRQGKQVFFFDRDEDVKAVINEHYAKTKIIDDSCDPSNDNQVEIAN